MDFKTGELFEMFNKQTNTLTRVSKMYDMFKVTATKSSVGVDVYIHEEKRRNYLHVPMSTFTEIMRDGEFMEACRRLEVNTSIKFTVCVCLCVCARARVCIYVSVSLIQSNQDGINM